MFRIFLPLLVLGAAAETPPNAPATPAGQAALDILLKSIPFRTVAGGEEVPKLAAFLADRLAEVGVPRSDMQFVPYEKTGYFTARFRGRDPKAKPLVLLAHLDVVDAKRGDWARDPFVPVVEDGYVYGRGALDDKAAVAIIVSTLARLKRMGWVPERDVILLLTGDEETATATAALAAKQLRNVDLVLNADAGFGIRDAEGKPLYLSLQAAEKTYADYTLTVTDPGGHSSQPRAVNAIVRMGKALERLSAFKFPARHNDVTLTYFATAAKITPGPLGAAMAAFSRNPDDTAALATLSANPEMVGKIRTTCVPTTIEGGHAFNALPQRVTVNVNCRIFPGDDPAVVRAALTKGIADPGVALTVRIELPAAPASPLRADVLTAANNAVRRYAPGVPVIPAMETGTTDSVHFRALGIPSYGVLGIFMKPNDVRSHGVDERVPVVALDQGSMHWESLIRELAGK